MTRFDMVFFDAGETLLRPHPSFHELFSATCRRAGYEIDVDLVHSVQQRLAPHLVELAEETGIVAPSLDPADSLTYWSHLYRRLLGELGIEDEDLIASLYSTFSSSASYKLYDDALPCLEALAGAGHRLGLISNFERWLEEMLVELEVGHHFEISIISGFVGVEKPDPAIYEAAVRTAGVEPGDAVHIGDSPTMDVEPAAEVGMTAILLDRWDRYPESRAPRVRSLSAIPALLANL
ncbi:MAG: HAD family hydrolase [Actinomycetota bacterium]